MAHDFTLVVIDPGKDGGLAIANPEFPRTTTVRKSPETPVQQAELLRDVVREAKADGAKNIIAIMEGVHSFPARMVPCPHCRRPVRQPQGSKSIWTFAQNACAWEIACFLCGVPVRKVTPSVWQRTVGFALSKEKPVRKNQLKSAAMVSFPHLRVTLWNADALMILRYAIVKNVWR